MIQKARLTFHHINPELQVDLTQTLLTQGFLIPEHLWEVSSSNLLLVTLDLMCVHSEYIKTLLLALHQILNIVHSKLANNI